MVISNEAYLKKMNIDKMPSSSDIDYIIETNDIVDFAAKEKDMALDFLIENFYDLLQIRSIGGENDMHYVICRLCSLFYFNQDKKNSIKNFMNSLSSANKKKIFEKYEPYIDNAALALTPECAFDDTIATTITAVVSDNTIKKTGIRNYWLKTVPLNPRHRLQPQHMVERQLHIMKKDCTG